jgi:hypothetical protein
MGDSMWLMVIIFAAIWGGIALLALINKYCCPNREE